MTTLLTRVAALVERRPASALLALLVLTVGFGVLATQQEVDTDLAAFAPESDLAAAQEVVAERFGQGGSAVQVVVDAGADGDVLSATGVAAAAAVTAIAEATPELAPLLVAPSPDQPAVTTFVLPLQAAAAAQGIDLADADDAVVDQLAAGVLGDPAGAAQAGALLSDDLDATAGTARAGLIVVQLDGSAPASAQAAAEVAFADALADAQEAGELDGVTVSALSEHLFADRLLADVEAELPGLLGLSLGLILIILLITYRRVSDVLIGLAGLVVVVVWTYGTATLLGPSYLGLTGPMSQISMMIPVLLIGLAIDYAIHLTSRYREDQAAGATPPLAARAAITSVGGALVLATVTTVVGFLTNVVSPLPPIRDFGIFVAAGVLAAFVVMVLLVPAARSLLDRRRAGSADAPAAATAAAPRGLERLMARAAVLSERHAITTLAVAAVVTVLAAGAATQVSTTFSQDEFVPEDSEIGQVLASVQALFGGDLDETTSVLVEGDVVTAEAAAAMLEATARTADTPGVRSAAGQPQVSSPIAVVAGLAADPALAEQIAGLGLDPTAAGPAALADDADVAGLYELGWQVAPQQMAGVLAEDGGSARLALSTAAGQDGAAALQAALEDDLAPLADVGLSVTVVSEQLLFTEALDALTASQTQGIAITLVVALLVLVAFFAVRTRRPVLGVITMIPSALVVAWVGGSMWLLGLSFNVMTAMVASLAIGIGVPYGIHITNRFTEDLARSEGVDEAVRRTVTFTGGALLGSATTTAAGFGVLGLASLVPVQQFGVITALTIVYSLIAAVLIEPACLKLWAQREQRRAVLAAEAEAPSPDDPSPQNPPSGQNPPSPQNPPSGDGIDARPDGIDAASSPTSR